MPIPILLWGLGALAATVIGAAAVSASDDADKAKQSAEEEAKRLIALEKEQTLQKERASRKASERGRIRAEATISLQQALDSLEPIIRKEGNLAFDFDGIRNFAGNTIRAPRSPFSKSVKLLGFKADDKVLQRLGKLESMGYFEKLAASEALLTDLAHIITLENEITALERIERRIETINENGNA